VTGAEFRALREGLRDEAGRKFSRARVAREIGWSPNTVTMVEKFGEAQILEKYALAMNGLVFRVRGVRLG
jgi:hypothetical protein